MSDSEYTPRYSEISVPHPANDPGVWFIGHIQYPDVPFYTDTERNYYIDNFGRLYDGSFTLLYTVENKRGGALINMQIDDLKKWLETHSNCQYGQTQGPAGPCYPSELTIELFEPVYIESELNAIHKKNVDEWQIKFNDYTLRRDEFMKNLDPNHSHYKWRYGVPKAVGWNEPRPNQPLYPECLPDEIMLTVREKAKNDYNCALRRIIWENLSFIKRNMEFLINAKWNKQESINKFTNDVNNISLEKLIYEVNHIPNTPHRCIDIKLAQIVIEQQKAIETLTKTVQDLQQKLNTISPL